MSAERVAAVLREIDRRIRVTSAAAPSPIGDWCLAVLRQHKAILERHQRYGTAYPDLEGEPEYANDCTTCDGAERNYPCPDVRGVLDCYPDTP